jgi:hypothetical protein
MRQSIGITGMPHRELNWILCTNVHAIEKGRKEEMAIKKRKKTFHGTFYPFCK